MNFIEPKDPSDYVIRDIRRKFWSGNWICLFVGLPRTGKTWDAISLAETINPNFDVNKHLFFSIHKFLEMIKRGEYKKGDIFILDEMGVEISARNWQSEENNIYSLLFQIIGFLNVGLIITVPRRTFIDVNIRSLCHSICSTISIDYKNQYAKFKMFNLSHDFRTNKQYEQFPFYYDDEGFKHKLKSFIIPCPSKDNSDKYIEREKEYKKLIIDKSLQQLDQINLEKNKDKSGQVKKHKHSWYVKGGKWKCKTCGEVTDKNPFV